MGQSEIRQSACYQWTDANVGNDSELAGDNVKLTTVVLIGNAMKAGLGRKS